MKKLLRLDSIDAGGRAKQEVHDILASRCIVSPHPDLPATQAEELATQVSLGQDTVSCLVPLPPLPQQPELHITFSCGLSPPPPTRPLPRPPINLSSTTPFPCGQTSFPHPLLASCSGRTSCYQS